MKRNFKKALGALMMIVVAALYYWLWVHSEPAELAVGSEVGVLMLGVPVPVIVPLIIGVFLVMLGLILIGGVGTQENGR